MDIRKEFKCTLHELTNIALGAASLTPSNTIILHSLLNLVLKKLNCHKEKVTINGFEAMQVDKLLKASKIPLLNLEEQTSIQSIQNLDKLDDLEKRLREMQLNLNGHLSEMLEEPQPTQPCQKRTPICKEDIFSVWDPVTRDTCEYLLYGDAAKKFHFRMIQPHMRAYEHVDKKLRALEEELGKTLQRITQTIGNVFTIEKVAKAIEDVSNKLTNVHEAFLQALQEIQDILAAKVDRADIAELLDNVYDKLRKLWRAVNDLENRGDCKKAFATICEKSLRPQQPSLKQSKLAKYTCDDDGIEAPTLLRRIQGVDTERIRLQVEGGDKNRRRSLRLSS